MPHRLAAKHAPTPLVEPKITKEEFAEFFASEQDSVKDSAVRAILKKLPPPSPTEIEAIGNYMACSNLAAWSNGGGIKEIDALKKAGNDFKKLIAMAKGQITIGCDGDEGEDIWKGSMAEVRDWCRMAAEGQPHTMFAWHHDRLLAGLYPTYFK